MKEFSEACDAFLYTTNKFFHTLTLFHQLSLYNLWFQQWTNLTLQKTFYWFIHEKQVLIIKILRWLLRSLVTGYTPVLVLL